MEDRTLTRLRWMTAGCIVIFSILFAVRMDLFKNMFAGDPSALHTIHGPVDHDTWMNLYLKDEKIGYSRSILSAGPGGHHLEEKLFMRLNMMGTVQNLDMATSAEMAADMRLVSFTFSLKSGVFDFSAGGRVEGDDTLAVKTDAAGAKEQIRIPLKAPIFLSAGMLPAAVSEYRASGKEEFVFEEFDPATLSTEPVRIRVAGDETIQNMGKRINTLKLLLDFKGTAQTAWVDQNGCIIKEAGLLGLTLDRTTPARAQAGILDDPEEDLVRLASVEADVPIENPRETALLTLEIKGIHPDRLQLDGGRQHYRNNRLTITRESPDADSNRGSQNRQELAAYLKPVPFIQSDHPDIIALAEKITNPADPPIVRVRSILGWIATHIKKRPVPSIPDALSTLKNRAGDCNEHAVLTAALCRAAGIPAKIEAGLVYTNGRFYYHAWNLIYAGRWITADAVFSQLPADATHIRLVSGNPRCQLDLMQVIDRISIKIIEVGYQNHGEEK